MVKYNSSGDHHKAGGEVQCNITQYLIFEILIFVMLVLIVYKGWKCETVKGDNKSSKMSQ